MGASNRPARPSVVTPGNYDGVHLGHRALIRAAREQADRLGPETDVVALTFYPHPLALIAPDRAPQLLTTPERRVELLRAAGADRVHIQAFDRAFSSLTPEAFAREVLVEELGARAVVVGQDFCFGAGRSGNVSVLQQLGEALGFEVCIVQPVHFQGAVASSSRVRKALGQGNVELAAQLLTRVHDVTRRVVSGNKRGRTIGVPTANLELTGLMPPADGVYAVCARILTPGRDPRRLGGVANLGVRPTLKAGRSMEVHLFDFEGDLYDCTLRVGFVSRLRGEQKFASLEALREQIACDMIEAKSAVERCDESLLAWI